ncbi:hypothetical protein FOMA001_g13054 [Fusarium oxysporum f. sp. matthiolae]|nr:hypothetical protein FOMA001_g13054 [Fusarium oxysporum f. sp. matthiolae]
MASIVRQWIGDRPAAIQITTLAPDIFPIVDHAKRRELSKTNTFDASV